MKKLLEFLILSIASHPKSVKIKEKTDQESGLITYEISVHPEDMGQIIGRQGKIIKAIRRLTYVLAVEKKQKINIQLMEK